MKHITLFSLLLLGGCTSFLGISPEDQTRVALAGADRAYNTLIAFQNSLDGLDLRHWVYSIHGTCMDPDRALLMQLTPKTRIRLDEACTALLDEVPEVHLIRRR